MKTINTATTNNNVNTAPPVTVSTDQNSKIFVNNMEWNGKPKGMRPMSSLTKTRSMMPLKTATHLFKK